MAEVDFYGETFYLTEPSDFTVMEFADVAERVGETSMAGNAALYRLLQECIGADPEKPTSTAELEWDRFRGVARQHRATSDALLPIAVNAISGASERPTERPSDSSDGPAPTLLRSVSPPADPAMERLSGRPDLQAALSITRRAASA